MRKAILCSTLATLTACAVPETQPPPSQQASTAPTVPLRRSTDCEFYRDLPDVFGYCLMTVAATDQVPETAQQVCGTAGAWERDCRHAWATARARGGMMDRNGQWHPSPWSTQELLTGCGDNEDCRFAILDTRHEDDVLLQLSLCVDHGGKYSHDCSIHALDRWMRTQPSPEEVTRVSSAPTTIPIEVGRYVAISVACMDTVACSGSDEVRSSCQAALVDIRSDAPFCETWQSQDANQPPKSPPGHGIR